MFESLQNHILNKPTCFLNALAVRRSDPVCVCPDANGVAAVSKQALTHKSAYLVPTLVVHV